MADENVPAPAPTRSDDHILPFAAWVPIGKSNHVLDLQKRQKKPIFQIAVDILQNINFFRAFTASASLDEDWFTLDANLLREALEITPIDQAHPFVSPPSGDAIMDFVNELGYPEAQISSSSIWGIITNTNVDYAELIICLAEKEGKKKSASTKQSKPKPVIKKSSKPAPTAKPKVTKEKSSKASTAKPPKPSLPKKSQPRLQTTTKCQSRRFQLKENDMERAIQMSLESFQAQGHAQNPATEEATTGPSAQPQDDTSANIIRDSPSPVDAETGVGSDKTSSRGDTKILQITEELGEDVEKHESLKFPADKHVLLEDPLSSTGTLSSMKNLEDAYAIRDQFINDKSTDDEPGNLNVEAEVVSMVTVPIYQASSSVPPLSTLVIDLSPPKPTSSTTQTPIFTATTTTTTTPLPPPPQQQSTTESELAERVTALEKKLSDLEQTNKNLDNTTRNLRSRVYTLELRDLHHKINEAIRENVK
ncbi:hypothetical protein Tco_1004329 [Tanacetum coccineum]|uniref:Uncharacterized protein n=1 Tax=Tanacetum coccineum TaxID=301880 RepID=A0ABQ5FBM2_9ASTR